MLLTHIFEYVAVRSLMIFVRGRWDEIPPCRITLHQKKTLSPFSSCITICFHQLLFLHIKHHFFPLAPYFSFQPLCFSRHYSDFFMVNFNYVISSNEHPPIGIFVDVNVRFCTVTLRILTNLIFFQIGKNKWDFILFKLIVIECKFFKLITRYEPRAKIGTPSTDLHKIDDSRAWSDEHTYTHSALRYWLSVVLATGSFSSSHFIRMRSIMAWCTDAVDSS